jgi:hypothetical protein
MSIQQIIREAIGEDKPTGFIGENSHLDTTFFKQEIGYQQALADIHSRIPEIEKKIIDEIQKTLQEHLLIKCPCENAECEHCKRLYKAMEEIDIKNLTS